MKKLRNYCIKYLCITFLAGEIVSRCGIQAFPFAEDVTIMRLKFLISVVLSLATIIGGSLGNVISIIVLLQR